MKKRIVLKIYNSRPMKSYAGFTLIEVMAAVSIIAMVLVGIYKMQAQTISMDYALKFYTLAPLLAQGKMTEIEIQSLEGQAGDSGVFGEEFPGYSWRVSFNDVESEALGKAAKDLIRVDATVSLNNDENVYNLRTYRFMRD